MLYEVSRRTDNEGLEEQEMVFSRRAEQLMRKFWMTLEGHAGGDESRIIIGRCPR